MTLDYLQTDEKDCGLIVLTSFFKKYYRKKLNINILKSEVNYSENGINIFSLTNLGEKIGLTLEALQGDFSSFLSLNIDEEIIALILDNNYYHYVIIENKDEEYVYLLDPAKGKIKLKLNDFKNKYLNIIITVNKNGNIDEKYLMHEKLDLFSNNIWPIILMLIMSFLGQILLFGSTYFIKYILDEIIAKNNNEKTLSIFLFFGWVFLLRIINNYLNSLLEQKLSRKFQYDLLNLFFKKTIHGKSLSLQKINKSDYIQRLNSIGEISLYYTNVINILFTNSISLLITSICLGIINWKLYILILGISLTKFIIIFYFKKNLHNKYPKLINNQIEITNKNFEIFLNNIYSKNPEYQTLSINKINDLLNAQKELNLSILNTTNWNKTTITFLNVLEQILIMYIGVNFFFSKNLSIGNLLLFNSLIMYIDLPIESLTNFLLNFKIMKQNIIRFEFVVFLAEENKNERYIQKISNIKIKNLSFNYDDRKIFDNISLDLNQNIIIEGKNGVGKSTFLKLLYGLYDEYQGNILINNEDELKIINLNDFRQKIYINSNNIYFPNLTIVEFITLKNEKALNTLKHNIEKYNLIELLIYFNLFFDTKIEDGGMNLSSGQRQLINLLQLFCFSYDLILLDEAFENISINVFTKLKDAIKDFQSEALFIEISHSKKYINNGKIINF
ncbi:cysteine peptidase family C39 domain-containing protein [Metamycoplasma faucium]|uniref:Cysteine peptidase family C39 domain-containing protein n=1 Tax=Metamycoplasma faucium TaxID=56142 RepID=A0ABZ2TQ53_9BACT